MENTATWRSERNNREQRGVGAALCGWTLEKPFAHGPVCESWLASRGIERAVVRVLSDRFAAHPRARTEWLRASWAASQFHHPRVVRVIEQGADERDTPVVVRGWVEGETLEEARSRGAIDSGLVLQLIEQLLDALEMAHAYGIVHGSLSPSNLIITLKGSVRLVDFAVGPSRQGHRIEPLDVLAAARIGRFTAPELRYAPPPPATPSEQSDIWSVGACMYFALTGAGPGTDQSPPEAAEELGRRWAVRKDIAEMVGYALSVDPLDRYGSAYAMLGDVRRLLAGRKPKLYGARAPVPSQSTTGRALLSPPSSPALIEPSTTPSPATERRGNIMLMIAIALLVGLATFVMARERLADEDQTNHSMTR
jgi:serine/threonine protein kinase